MADDSIDTGNAARPEHVTVIREGRGSGGMIVALIALVIVALVAIWAMNSRGDSSDGNVAAAADKVGAAAEKVGNAAEDAADRVAN